MRLLWAETNGYKKKIEAKKQQAQNRCTMEPEPAQGAPYVPAAQAGHVPDAEPGTSREKERRPAPDAAETAALESEKLSGCRNSRVGRSSFGRWPARAGGVCGAEKKLYRKLRPCSVLLFFILMLAYNELAVKLVSYGREATSFFFPVFYSVFTAPFLHCCAVCSAGASIC